MGGANQLGGNMTETQLTPEQVVEKFRAALARADSLGKVAACMDRAFQLLPYSAVRENGIVLFECEAKTAALRKGGKL